MSSPHFSYANFRNGIHDLMTIFKDDRTSGWTLNAEGNVCYGGDDIHKTYSDVAKQYLDFLKSKVNDTIPSFTAEIQNTTPEKSETEFLQICLNYVMEGSEDKEKLKRLETIHEYIEQPATFSSLLEKW